MSQGYRTRNFLRPANPDRRMRPGSPIMDDDGKPGWIIWLALWIAALVVIALYAEQANAQAYETFREYRDRASGSRPIRIEPEPASATAAEPSRWLLNVHGASVHFRNRPDGRRFNGANYGAGIEYEHDRAVGFAAGAYLNSIDRTTGYVLARLTPIEAASWRLGGVVGLASGYEANHGGPTPVAALAAVSPEWRGVSVQLVGLPNGIHPKVVGFAAASLRVRF